MPILLITVQSAEQAIKVASAISSVIPSASIQYYEEGQLPDSDSAAVPEELLSAVREMKASHRLSEAMDYILYGGNSIEEWIETENKNYVRTALSTISRKLKPILGENPLDALVERRKTFFDTGCYKGISYHPTKLGRKLGQLLKST
jgi:hypothetical protein